MTRSPADALASAAARIREIAAGYDPPDFAHVPDLDSALFLCAVDHRTGYERAHALEPGGPAIAGSELMWELGLRSAAAEPGLLTASRLLEVGAEEVAEWFEIEGETVDDPERRAELWRGLAEGMLASYGGRATILIEACGGLLAGPDGLIERLAVFEAFADPLAKKAFLFAKVCERRGWLEVADPDAWQVSADNVLMRIALRSGLVEPGPLDDVRAATRDALRELADAAELSPPVLDDLLWELGRDDPDLLGREAGDLSEPERTPGVSWY